MVVFLQVGRLEILIVVVLIDSTSRVFAAALLVQALLGVRVHNVLLVLFCGCFLLVVLIVRGN